MQTVIDVETLREPSPAFQYGWIEQWQRFREEQASQPLREWRQLVLAATASAQVRKVARAEEWNQTLVAWEGLLRSRRENNRIHGTHFNAFRLFPPNENQQSLLIGTLLDPNAEHGQGTLFLHAFLNQLGIYEPKQGQWQITIGTQYLDVRLTRKHPFSVVILENKSNDAQDQQHQLYWYWYNHIYCPCCTRTSARAGHEHHRVVYLAPSDEKRPSSHAVLRHPNCPADAPAQIPPEFVTVWDYPRKVTAWLSDCLQHIPPTNHRVRDYVQQYIELWSKHG